MATDLDIMEGDPNSPPLCFKLHAPHIDRRAQGSDYMMMVRVGSTFDQSVILDSAQTDPLVQAEQLRHPITPFDGAPHGLYTIKQEDAYGAVHVLAFFGDGDIWTALEEALNSVHDGDRPSTQPQALDAAFPEDYERQISSQVRVLKVVSNDVEILICVTFHWRLRLCKAIVWIQNARLLSPASIFWHISPLRMTYQLN